MQRQLQGMARLGHSHPHTHYHEQEGAEHKEASLNHRPPAIKFNMAADETRDLLHKTNQNLASAT